MYKKSEAKEKMKNVKDMTNEEFFDIIKDTETTSEYKDKEVDRF